LVPVPPVYPSFIWCCTRGPTATITAVALRTWMKFFPYTGDHIPNIEISL
jgi:hypothetical protein